jgi:hypothetical protein
MGADIIDGKAFAAVLRGRIAERVAALTAEQGIWERSQARRESKVSCPRRR